MFKNLFLFFVGFGIHNIIISYIYNSVFFSLKFHEEALLNPTLVENMCDNWPAGVCLPKSENVDAAGEKRGVAAATFDTAEIDTQWYID